MAPPNVRRAAAVGAASDPREADRLAGSISPTNSKSDLILQQLDWARDRLDTLEQLGRWLVDLRAELWRERHIFMLVDAEHDFGPFAEKLKAYKRVRKAFDELRRVGA
jgi:hypothetical protein